MSHNRFHISPSLLSASFANIQEAVQRINELEDELVDWIHFDVMDNHFVPNLTFGHKLIKDVRPFSKKFFDVHLMITEPEKVIDRFIDAGSDLITIHVEASFKVIEVLQTIRKAGIKAGLSIRPKTPVNVLMPYLSHLDLILIMTVEPGYGGQPIIPEAIEKIQETRQIIEKENKAIVIEADGGINLDNVDFLHKKGMNVAVMGNAFFNQQDLKAFSRTVHGKIASAGKSG